jgi:large subunit ribosomal protein L21
MYAIIRTGGQQFKVEEGDVLDVEHLRGEGEITLTPLLVVDDKGKVFSRRDQLKDAEVVVKILGVSAGPKVDIFKYKAKTGYRRHQGHRQRYTKIEVAAIKSPGVAAKPPAKAAVTEPADAAAAEPAAAEPAAAKTAAAKSAARPAAEKPPAKKPATAKAAAKDTAAKKPAAKKTTTKTAAKKTAAKKPAARTAAAKKPAAKKTTTKTAAKKTAAKKPAARTAATKKKASTSRSSSSKKTQKKEG